MMLPCFRYCYTVALVRFRLGGDSKKSRKALREAVKCNPDVCEIMCNSKSRSLVAGVGHFQAKLPSGRVRGDLNEASEYLGNFQKARV